MGPLSIKRVIGLEMIRPVFDIAPRLGLLKAGGADRKRHDKYKSLVCKGHVIPTSDE